MKTSRIPSIFGDPSKVAYLLAESLGKNSTVLIPDGYDGQDKTTILISHKHNDLEDLKGLLGFLESTYNVKVYIDSQDPNISNRVCNCRNSSNYSCCKSFKYC